MFELSRNAGPIFFGPEIWGRKLVCPLPHG